MKCLVTIKGADGAAYRSYGDLVSDGKTLFLTYKIEGDECRLTACGKDVRETRRGDVCLDLHFVEGEETKGVIGEDGAEGSFPIFTESVNLRRARGGAELKLVYECCGEKVVLRLSCQPIGKN